MEKIYTKIPLLFALTLAFVMGIRGTVIIDDWIDWVTYFPFCLITGVGASATSDIIKTHMREMR